MINRRELLTNSALTGVISAMAARSRASLANESQPPAIIDTNVSLFRWPFRRLPLDETHSLVNKLQSLGTTEAWAGSFEGVLHGDIAAVNQRLVDACRHHPLLIPVGCVNVNLPGWESDWQQCIGMHDMAGVRVFPNYHGYRLDDPRFLRLLQLANQARRFVQIAVALEDQRTQHPRMSTPDVDLRPLPDALRQVPGVSVQILNARPQAAMIELFSGLPGVFFDTARVEATDGVPQLVQQLPQGRVLFGSHAPFLIPEAALIRTHESSQLDGATLQAVLASNARTFRGQVAYRRQTPLHQKPVDEPAISKGSQLGLPASERLEAYRIWDAYFTPAHAHPGRDGYDRLKADIERALPAIRKVKIKKLCYFAHVGVGTIDDAELERSLRSNPSTVLKPIEAFPELLLGLIQLNANDVPASLDAIQRWIVDGPMLGVYFPGGGPAALTCTHRNFDLLVDAISRANGVIMQHTWFNSLGKKHPGASTPAELAELARRFPDQKFVCAHAGGEWQQGIRAVRRSTNLLIETSGFDATAQFIEMAVRELGAERVVFGSHLPSRSLGTELGKVIGARITESEKRLILGEACEVFFEQSSSDFGGGHRVGCCRYAENNSNRLQ